MPAPRLNLAPGTKVRMNNRTLTPEIGREAVVVRFYERDADGEMYQLNIEGIGKRIRYTYRFDVVDDAASFVPEDWS